MGSPLHPPKKQKILVERQCFGGIRTTWLESPDDYDFFNLYAQIRLANPESTLYRELLEAMRQRAGVLQLFFDDDNDQLRQFSGAAVPGGHAAFTGTASVYSGTPITDEDLSIESTDAATNAFYTYVTGLRDALEEAEAALDLADPTDTAAVAAATAAVDAKRVAVRALLRVAVPDPAMVHQELPGCVGDLRL